MEKKLGTTITPPAKGRHHVVMKDGVFDVTTFAHKEEDLTEVTIETCTFLGRTPGKFLGKHIAWRLNESTIHAIPFWRLDNFITEANMESQLCDSAIREWFYYGEEVFTYWKNKYDTELLRVGSPVTSLSWAKALADWHDAQF
jgi:hypothetical protein